MGPAEGVEAIGCRHAGPTVAASAEDVVEAVDQLIVRRQRLDEAYATAVRSFPEPMRGDACSLASPLPDLPNQEC